MRCTAAKDHINLFLYDGGIVPDPEGIITGGHDRLFMYAVAWILAVDAGGFLDLSAALRSAARTGAV